MSITTEMDYLDSFQYLNGKLSFFPHAEGYVNIRFSKYGDMNFNYFFNYTDHLGNIRVSYSDGGNSEPKIMEENHYYPFGLKHTKYNTDSYEFVLTENGNAYTTGIELIPPGTSNVYKYKYNGKEYQQEFGLNLYDYGARNYDPAIGRWMNIDPLAEVSRRWSPYNYAMDNPIYFIDPDGMMANRFGLSGENVSEEENDDWVVYKGKSGQEQVIYDAEIKSREQADKKYGDVTDSFKSGSITGTANDNSTFSYHLNENGTVTDNNTNSVIENGFTTPQGTYVGENKSALSQLAPLLSNSGDLSVGIGVFMVCTGVLSPVGAGLITYGGYTSAAGTVLDLANDANSGNWDNKKAVTKGIMFVIPAGGDAAFKTLGVPAAGAAINGVSVGVDHLLDEMRDSKAGPYRKN
jgi:RHS repeat-associated protein